MKKNRFSKNEERRIHFDDEPYRIFDMAHSEFKNVLRAVEYNHAVFTEEWGFEMCDKIAKDTRESFEKELTKMSNEFLEVYKEISRPELPKKVKDRIADLINENESLKSSLCDAMVECGELEMKYEIVQRSLAALENSKESAQESDITE